MQNYQIIEPLGQLLAVLDQLEIRYTIGGSVASSVYGQPRYTNDVDLTADIRPEHIPEFCRLTGPHFVIPDQDTILRSLASGRSFNVIHSATILKVDIFPVANRPFHRSFLDRGIEDILTYPDGSIECTVATPEDIMLAKLNWFRRSNSEQQWRDLLGVARRQQGKLDLTYLYHWAKELEVTPLLDKLLADAPRR